MERTSINDVEQDNINSGTAINTLGKESINNLNKNPTISPTQSREKILHLPDGRKKRACVLIVFFISLIVLVVSIGITSAARLPIFAIGIVAGAIGVFYAMIIGCCCSGGFITIAPNEAVVYQYYGRYLGTVKDNGYFFGYPMAKIFRMSLRSNQYNGNRLKVNERDGNPVELGIVVVWKIGDTAKAIFDVENYQAFIIAQAEAAIRYIGCKYPYEPIIPGEISLRSGHEIINKELKKELERRIAVSGIIIEDARVTEISYGAEVANMMLQKQASNATVFAKDAIVKGATNAVMKSLDEFERNGIGLSDNEKANYIIEMMNTLCTSSAIHKIV